jgi:hypothetical protein
VGIPGRELRLDLGEVGSRCWPAATGSMPWALAIAACFLPGNRCLERGLLRSGEVRAVGGDGLHRPGKNRVALMIPPSLPGPLPHRLRPGSRILITHTTSLAVCSNYCTAYTIQTPGSWLFSCCRRPHTANAAAFRTLMSHGTRRRSKPKYASTGRLVA